MRLLATIPAILALCAVSVPAGAGEDEYASAQQAWLAAHNEARSDFGVSPLAWDDALADDARNWARDLARRGTLEHAPLNRRNGAGENLWMGSAGFYRPAQMIAHFVDEKRHFAPGRFPAVSRTGNWADVGHFTQIVWGETRKVGCASARGARFDVLVCRYWPAGNVMGEWLAPAAKVARR